MPDVPNPSLPVSPVVDHMLLMLSLLLITPLLGAFQGPHRQHNRLLLSDGRRRYRTKATATKRLAVSEEAFLDGDLVAILPQPKPDTAPTRPRLCVVRSDGIVFPLCTREDDVETDLFADPREYDNVHWTTRKDDDVIGRYGEGFYGQRPVPSLGGGPGYGAPANEIWSISDSTLVQIMADHVEVPKLNVGIAHGERARGGGFF
jgi:hypothetical protein